MAIEKRDIVFPSGDSYCAAWLFLPDGASPSARVPGVAMAHGLGAVKEMYLEFFARNFAEAGIAAVLFDYRHFGASGGEPRQRVAPNDQTEDYRSALTCLSLQPEVDADRLGVWGTSFSGGHVLHVAAYDPRVKAVVSQVGAMDADAIMKATATAEQYATLEQMTVKERIRRATEGGEVYIPNTLSPGQTFAFQPDPESYQFAHKAQATVAPSWRDEVTMSSIGACLEYAPARSIDLIAPRPLLMFLAKSDPIAPALLHESVGGEWSFIETLRHLVFATDSWIRRAILGDPSPWDPPDLPWDEMPDTPGVLRDRDVRPSLDVVLELRDRMATIREVVDGHTDETLDGDTEPVEGPGWPKVSPPEPAAFRQLAGTTSVGRSTFTATP